MGSSPRLLRGSCLCRFTDCHGFLARVEEPTHLLRVTSFLFVFLPWPNQRQETVDGIRGLDAVQNDVPTIALGVVFMLGPDRFRRAARFRVELTCYGIGETARRGWD